MKVYRIISRNNIPRHYIHPRIARSIKIKHAYRLGAHQMMDLISVHDLPEIDCSASRKPSLSPATAVVAVLSSPWLPELHVSRLCSLKLSRLNFRLDAAPLSGLTSTCHLQASNTPSRQSGYYLDSLLASAERAATASDKFRASLQKLVIQLYNAFHDGIELP